MTKHSGILVAAVLAAALPAVAEDLTIVSKSTMNGKPLKTQTSYLASDHTREPSGDGEERIIDFKADRTLTLNNKTKTFYVTTRKERDDIAAEQQRQMSSLATKNQKGMKDVSVGDQKKASAAIGSLVGEIDVRKTGTTRKIAGYTCENWMLSFGQLSTTETCLAPEIQIPAQPTQMTHGEAEAVKSTLAILGPLANAGTEMAEKMKNMKGYPLASMVTISAGGMKITSGSEVTEVKRGPIPASTWEVPPGYSKIENPALKTLHSSK